MPRLAIRLGIVLLLLTVPELAQRTLEHIGIGMLIAWLGIEHASHSPPLK